MATPKQELGALGEELVVQHCACPRCKRPRTLKRLPPNFKCADVICDFCAYVGQVKASTNADVSAPPPRLLGAAWEPQQARMQAGIYIPLFLVLVTPGQDRFAIYYLSADLQTEELFLPRNPLSVNAKRSGWRGFNYDLESVHDRFVMVAEGVLPKRRARGGSVANEPPV